MMNQAIQDALNKQLNAEFFTTNNYLAMSAKFRSMGLHGFAHWPAFRLIPSGNTR